MSFRITSNGTKTGYVVVSYLIALLVALAVVLTAGFTAAAAVWGILLVVCVGGAVRSFRGESESREAPRAWWRMSARPTSGFVFAVLFLLQGVSLVASCLLNDNPVQSANAASFLVLAVLNLIIGVFFAHSSIRLLRRQGMTTSGEA